MKTNGIVGWRCQDSGYILLANQAIICILYFIVRNGWIVLNMVLYCDGVLLERALTGIRESVDFLSAQQIMA